MRADIIRREPVQSFGGRDNPPRSAYERGEGRTEERGGRQTHASEAWTIRLSLGRRPGAPRPSGHGPDARPCQRVHVHASSDGVARSESCHPRKPGDASQEQATPVDTSLFDVYRPSLTGSAMILCPRSHVPGLGEKKSKTSGTATKLRGPSARDFWPQRARRLRLVANPRRTRI